MCVCTGGREEGVCLLIRAKCFAFSIIEINVRTSYFPYVYKNIILKKFH